jgi:hypothetical protein
MKEDLYSSGSIRKYYKENEISYDSFQYWRYKKNHVRKINNSKEKKVSVKKLIVTF